uniref:Uncharacterized protein n=1 Tax=uncultured prokaryote TaxID=198431 RepID=A0A0H5Q5C4_9ZZZZ|nr:hypothetical protein [uncultured prokaryote]
MAILAQVVLKMDSDIPADACVNTLWFEVTPDVGQTIVDVIDQENGGVTGDDWGIHEAILNMYDDWSAIYSPVIDPAAGEVKYYDMDGPPPHYPIAVRPLALTTVDNASLPAEVALCLSFQAQKFSGVPQASRRGRIYLGPMGGSATGLDGRPESVTVGLITTAASAFLDRGAANPQWSWVVWSTKNETSAPVADGWVDNAWDTQRRRGLIPTSRDVFAL